MASVTFQLIEGLERGRAYSELATPVTIGREDDNSIQLNDERVSRFHAKIQDDDGRIILTDLDSTNGTRVNGHPVQMRVLQFGDQVSIGRCLLIYGSREDIAGRFGDVSELERDQEFPDPGGQTIAAPNGLPLNTVSSDSDSGLSAVAPSIDDSQPELFPQGPPPPPDGMRPADQALVSDFVAYAHEQISRILQSGVEDPDPTANGAMYLSRIHWQRLLHLEMELAVYLRKLADPDS